MGGFVFSIMFAFVMWMAAIAMAIMAVITICALMNYIFESSVSGFSDPELFSWISGVDPVSKQAAAGTDRR